MTREEAIGWLQRWQSTLRGDGSPLELAILVAIEALKQPEIIRCGDCVFSEDGEGCTMHNILTDPDDFCCYAAWR